MPEFPSDRAPAPVRPPFRDRLKGWAEIGYKLLLATSAALAVWRSLH